MDRLGTEITAFLSENGFHFHYEIPEGMHTGVIRTEVPRRWILPVGISAVTPEEAAFHAEETAKAVEAIKEMTGTSFMEYLIEYRLGKAAQELKLTNDTILEISGRTGFDNISNFNRLFKKRLGVTPSEFRRK